LSSFNLSAFIFVRLAVVLSHPIQYYSPWFRFLAAHGFDGLRVFYLWDGGVTEQLDRGFGVAVKWDVPLLEGYDHEFVPNVSRHPGTSGWRGLDNPALSGRLAAFKPDAILLFGYNYKTHYRLLFSKLRRRIPILFRGDSHRLPQAGSRERGRFNEVLRQRWISFVYRRFDAFLYTGQANKSYFQIHGVPDEKLFFCPHAVDNERFFAQAQSASEEAAKWKASLGIASDQKVVLFAGKFEAKKRPRDLVAAFKQAQMKDTVLLLVGNGEQEEALKQDAAGRTDIVFAPFQNQTQMPRTYAMGDVFVLPSFGRGETWGLAVNEAMCLGRPIIVSNHVGCAQDLVQPGRNGSVFSAGDVTALTAALREALADVGRLQTWGAQSQEIIQDYDYGHATGGVLAALEFLKKQKQGK
jgi:glycosyltransferase involved in cell wall biosynthesis